MRVVTRVFVIAVLLAALVLTSGASGCTGDDNLATAAAEDTLEAAGVAGYSVKEGDAAKVDSNMCEGDQMIAKMRLLEYGMSPNFEDYRCIYLVEMKNEAGESIMMVSYEPQETDGEILSLAPKSVTGEE